MNKALILKYKTEFDYWLNSGNVQVYYKKDDEPKWLTDEECIEYESHDNFSHIIRNSLEPEDVLIIIDDEYIEFRKALAEGNTIQYYECIYQHEMDVNLNRYDWLDWKSATPSSSFTKTLKYRIKPEEPKFKVGDWLIEIHSGSYAKVLEVFTQEVRVKLYDCNSIITTENTDFKLWKPQLGELVILDNKNDIISIIKYNGETNVYPFIGEITWLHKKD